MMIEKMLNSTRKGQGWEGLVSSLGFQAQQEICVFPIEGCHEDGKLMGLEVCRPVFFLFAKRGQVR